MANTISMFDSRTMLMALEQMYVPSQFLLDTFFKEENYSLTDTIDIDIVKGNRKVAPFVKPIHEGKVVERLGYYSSSVKPPYIKVKMKTEAGDLLKRLAGQNVYLAGAQTIAQRAAEQLNKDMSYLQNLILRREEAMAAQALTTGKVTMVGDGFNHEIDFQIPANQIVDATTAWDEETADPIEDLRALYRKIQLSSGMNPDKCIMGHTAIGHFMANEKVQKYFDNRRFELGVIAPSMAENYSYYVGTLKFPGLILEIYGYNEIYVDENGATQYMMPLTGVSMGCSKARCIRQYAVIQDLKAEGNAAVRWFPKSWETDDPSARWIMLQSAPVPCLIQSDAFGFIETDLS